jgi:hypothetical protein
MHVDSARVPSISAAGGKPRSVQGEKLLGEGTDCSGPAKAITVGEGLFQLDALIFMLQ